MNDSFTIGPALMTYRQYRAICDALTDAGYWNRERRMRRLSALLGRTVTDYGQLTADDASLALNGLEKETRGAHR